MLTLRSRINYQLIAKFAMVFLVTFSLLIGQTFRKKYETEAFAITTAVTLLGLGLTALLGAGIVYNARTNYDGSIIETVADIAYETLETIAMAESALSQAMTEEFGLLSVLDPGDIADVAFRTYEIFSAYFTGKVTFDSGKIIQVSSNSDYLFSLTNGSYTSALNAMPYTIINSAVSSSALLISKEIINIFPRLRLLSNTSNGYFSYGPLIGSDQTYSSSNPPIFRSQLGGAVNASGGSASEQFSKIYISGLANNIARNQYRERFTSEAYMRYGSYVTADLAGYPSAGTDYFVADGSLPVYGVYYYFPELTKEEQATLSIFISPPNDLFYDLSTDTQSIYFIPLSFVAYDQAGLLRYSYITGSDVELLTGSVHYGLTMATSDDLGLITQESIYNSVLTSDFSQGLAALPESIPFPAGSSSAPQSSPSASDWVAAGAAAAAGSAVTPTAPAIDWPSFGDNQLELPNVAGDFSLNALGSLFSWLGSLVMLPLEWLGNIITTGFDHVTSFIFSIPQALSGITTAVTSGFSDVISWVVNIPAAIANIGSILSTGVNVITAPIVASITSALDWAFVIDTVSIQSNVDIMYTSFTNRVPIFGDIITMFRNLFNGLDGQPPEFSVTLPQQWGGGTYSYFNIAIIDPYMPTIRSIAAGFFALIWGNKFIKKVLNYFGKGGE